MFVFPLLGLAIEAFVLVLTLSGIPMAFVLWGEHGGLRLSLALCANKCTQALLKHIGLESVWHIPSRRALIYG